MTAVVRLSVCPVPDRRARKGILKLNIGRMEAPDTGDLWPHSEIERPKVKVTRPIN